jgi:dUTP pyrophosphatase
MSILPKISFIKTHPDAKLPQQNNKDMLTGDTGYDIYCVEDTFVDAHSTQKVECGLEIAHIDAGYWIRVESRSGLYFKHGLTVFNGIIDNCYRGMLGISMINNSDKSYTIMKGDRIAQLVIYKLEQVNMSWAENKTETNRGDKGFGSSGR